jgi:hypothetical protein
VIGVGRYMLNMGVIEMVTRAIIARMVGNDRDPIFAADLDARVRYIRKRFPRADLGEHKRAMKNFSVALKLVGFRNAIAHSGLILHSTDNSPPQKLGLFNITVKSNKNFAEIISIEELNGRVEESAKLGGIMLLMQERTDWIIH